MRHLKEFTVKIQALRKDFDRKRRKLPVSTQVVREALIVDLEEAFEFAKQRMHAVRKERYKQLWARIMAYIAQTIAYIASEYDSNKILERLEQLEERVDELRKKDQQAGKGT